MKEPIKLAFAGDWHGNTHWAVMAVRYAAAQGVDTIFHLGDYGFTFNHAYVNDVERECAKRKVMIYFIDGNHDNHEYLWTLPLDEDGFGILSDHVRFIPRGKRWQTWGLTWLGLGGAHSVDRPGRTVMIDWWPTEWITDAEYATANKGGKVDVMIAHDCPSGVGIPTITRANGLKFFSVMELNNADEHRRRLRTQCVDIVQPKLYVHGHYHVRYGGTQPGPRQYTRYVGLAEDATSMGDNLWIVENKQDMGF